MKCISLAVVVVVLLSMSVPLYAQGGCVNSPENPTVVLGLLSAAGAGMVYLRRRVRSGRNKESGN
jgi:XrtJ-associated TM-motif-TM protein